MFRRRALVGSMVVGLLASTVALGGTAAARPGPPAWPDETVTLPTGDRVTLGGSGELDVLPAKGREHLRFHQTTDASGAVRVVPSDMVPKVAAGEVDPRAYTVVPPRREPRAATGVEHAVEIQLIDRDGAPARLYSLTLHNLATGQTYNPHDDSGIVQTELPEGRYLVLADVRTMIDVGTASDTYFAEPAFVVDGYEHLVLDARRGNPMNVGVDQPNAQEGRTRLEFLATTPVGRIGLRMYGASGFRNEYLAPSTTSAPEFRFGLQAELAQPDGSGGFADSPYLYHVRWGEDGRVPSDVDRSFTDDQLAKVLSEHAMATPGLHGMREGMVSGELPFSLTEYYTPGVPWEGGFSEFVAPVPYPQAWSGYAKARVYSTDRVTQERWNTAVFSPSFVPYTAEPDYYPHISRRTGDNLYVDLSLFADQDPSRIGGSYRSGTTELTLDGEVLRSIDDPGGLFLQVPPEPGTYTLRSTAHRTERLSTMVDSQWTFRSAHTEEPTDLPLLAVRFAPTLDLANTAPAGQFRLPVYVQRNGLGTVHTRPTVDVSYDDGARWTRARGRYDGNGWFAVLNHPRDAEFVSLRGTATDGDSGVTQTILRAYALR